MPCCCSVLGPLLYVLYTAELAKVVPGHGLQMHQYANDIQIYTYTTINDAASTVDRFTACLTNVEASLRASRLRLNPTKTQVMWLGSSQQLAKLDISHVHVLLSCRTQLVTLASSSTASCHCRLTSLRSVEVATTSCANCGRLSGRCLVM